MAHEDPGWKWQSVPNDSMKDCGPACPQQVRAPFEGMSLRDWFAGQAILQKAVRPGEFINPDEIADDAYCVADAMLKRRDKFPEDERK